MNYYKNDYKNKALSLVTLNNNREYKNTKERDKDTRDSIKHFSHLHSKTENHSKKSKLNNSSSNNSNYVINSVETTENIAFNALEQIGSKKRTLKFANEPIIEEVYSPKTIFSYSNNKENNEENNSNKIDYNKFDENRYKEVVTFENNINKDINKDIIEDNIIDNNNNEEEYNNNRELDEPQQINNSMYGELRSALQKLKPVPKKSVIKKNPMNNYIQNEGMKMAIARLKEMRHYEGEDDEEINNNNDSFDD